MVKRGKTQAVVRAIPGDPGRLCCRSSFHNPQETEPFFLFFSQNLGAPSSSSSTEYIIILLRHGHYKLFFSTPYSEQGNLRRKTKGLSGFIHEGNIFSGHLLLPHH